MTRHRTSSTRGATTDPAAAVGVGPRPDDGPVFSDRARLLGATWIGLGLVVCALVGTVIRTPEGFLFLMPVTSGLFTVPAIVVSAVAARRITGPFRVFWRWYLVANLALYAVGSAVAGHAVRPRPVYQVMAVGGLAVLMVSGGLAIAHVLRTRSGARSRSVDLVESGLAIVLVTAPVLVVYGEEIRRSPFAWFAGVSLVCVVMFTSALWCTVVLFVRSPRGRRRSEGVAVALWVAAVVDSIAQIEHVVSGFRLANPPLLVLNGLCMGLLLLVPLHARHRMAVGQERLPPQSQIRSGKVIAGVTLAALPLLGGVVVVAGRTATAVHIAGFALAALVALSAVRQLLTYSETRRLYAEVERSAEDRRALLAAVLESMNADRRRVAMQLHEQASSSYAALAALVPTDGPTGADLPAGAAARPDAPPEAWAARLRPVPLVPVSQVLTERMAAQAESLRELIGAIRPQASAGAAGLAPILQAYVDSLEDGTAPPVTVVDVAEDLVLDWVTETVALRVVQEAVHNACRHAHASELRISLVVEEGVAVVRVRDDGTGFDPGAVVESGIATMRRFVEFCEGELAIHSRRDGGTLIEARLGGARRDRPGPPRLRPVRG